MRPERNLRIVGVVALITTMTSTATAQETRSLGMARSSAGEVGQRQTREQVAAQTGSEPLARINNRVSNRVNSRLENRLGPQLHLQTLDKSIEAASDQARTPQR